MWAISWRFAGHGFDSASVNVELDATDGSLQARDSENIPKFFDNLLYGGSKFGRASIPLDGSIEFSLMELVVILDNVIAWRKWMFVLDDRSYLTGPCPMTALDDVITF